MRFQGPPGRGTGTVTAAGTARLAGGGGKTMITVTDNDGVSDSEVQTTKGVTAATHTA
jgi:hypothetical protein